MPKKTHRKVLVVDNASILAEQIADAEPALNIRPFNFSFMDWRTRSQQCYTAVRNAIATCPHDCHPGLAAANAIGDWQRATDNWFRKLPPNDKQDAYDLAVSEITMLWETLEPIHPDAKLPQVGSWEFTDFRDRYYTVASLIAILARTDGVSPISQSHLDASLDSLASRAYEREFLP